jgi:hypothetical protein
MFVVSFGNKKPNYEKLILVLSIFCFLASCQTQNKTNLQEIFSAEGKKAAIFTTPDSTDLRLCLMWTAGFIPAHAIQTIVY